jgi:hypothetical protein
MPAAIRCPLYGEEMLKITSQDYETEFIIITADFHASDHLPLTDFIFDSRRRTP